MESRLWPSTFPATSTCPSSSGPLWTTRASMREADSGSMPPYPPMIPHISLRSPPGSGRQTRIDVTRGQDACLSCRRLDEHRRAGSYHTSTLADAPRQSIGEEPLEVFFRPASAGALRLACPRVLRTDAASGPARCHGRSAGTPLDWVRNRQCSGLRRQGMLVRNRGVEPVIDPSAFAAPTAVLVGRVSVGSEARIMYGSVLDSEASKVEVGECAIVCENSVLRATSAGGADLSVVGDHAFVGPHATLLGCVVELACYLATGATVLQGATVGSGAVVAVGALVH